MNYNYINPQTLWQLQQAGQAPTIIDVRGKEAYSTGHIPGAIHIPADELSNRLAEKPADQPVVAY